MCTVEFFTIKLSCNKKIKEFLEHHKLTSSLKYSHRVVHFIFLSLFSDLKARGDVIIRYAREDTHYLLYIYDMLRVQLVSMRSSAESDVDDALLQVCGIALLIRCHPAL